MFKDSLHALIAIWSCCFCIVLAASFDFSNSLWLRGLDAFPHLQQLRLLDVFNTKVWIHQIAWDIRHSHTASSILLVIISRSHELFLRHFTEIALLAATYASAPFVKGDRVGIAMNQFAIVWFSYCVLVTYILSCRCHLLQPSYLDNRWLVGSAL